MASMFDTKVPTLPKTPEVEPMPAPDNAATLRNARRTASVQRQQSGIPSTVLSRRSSRETLGG